MGVFTLRKFIAPYIWDLSISVCILLYYLFNNFIFIFSFSGTPNWILDFNFLYFLFFNSDFLFWGDFFTILFSKLFVE